MVAEVTRLGSLYARHRLVRNLRAAPSFLTPARVDQIVTMLDMARPKLAPPTLWPESPTNAPSVPSPLSASAPAPAPEKAKRAPRKVREKVAAEANAPAAVTIDPPVATPVATPAPVVAAELPRAAASRPGRTVSALAPASAPVGSAPPANPAPARLSAAPMKTAGVQNAASAIDWLRSHGVSVKAARTSIYGTLWLVSGDWREFDAAAIVEIAKAKGFPG